MTRVRTAGLAACTLAAVAGSAFGQAHTQSPGQVRMAIHPDGHDRIFDPKIIGAGAVASFHLSGGGSVAAKAEVHGPAGMLKPVWSGILVGGAPPTQITWDGRDAVGDYVDTGDYVLRVGAQTGGGPVLTLPITVVRLGVTEIEFQESGAADEEWQMVYFMKGSSDGVFYATPAVHEYLNTGKIGEVSDLDLDDGDPRPPVPRHFGTAEPVMDGINYETERYNYPVAYLAGATMRLEATVGATGTSASGVPMPAGYPVPGYDLRLVATYQDGTSAASGPIQPGDSVTLDGPDVPAAAGRSGLGIDWSWQYAPAGTGAWTDVPGAATTAHRVYSLIAAPKFKAGATGTQYTGPWVEMAEYFAYWKQKLGTDTTTEDGVVETFVKGYFGQNGGIPEAIEGVVYDTNVLGGDGGATHYFQTFGSNMDLSALLNAHAKGVYVNCTDCMGGTTTGISMLGVADVRPVRLGPMTLKAIWGIGAPDYTTALWGTAHSFSYHHIVTRTDGFDVIDTCMQLDEDGSPGSTPGLPGWNADRLWGGIGGYDDLSSYNTVSKTLELLPGLL